MKVLVDTPIWSEYFRRSTPNTAATEGLEKLIREGGAILIGPVRQEVLSGIREVKQYERLVKALRPFPNEDLPIDDFELAAKISNDGRARGIQGSPTDFLLCAVAIRLQFPIFTLDRDFAQYASLFPLDLYEPN